MKKPTESNSNSWYRGRAPDLKDYQCDGCGGKAVKFFSYSRTAVYSAVCDKCLDEYQRANIR